MSWNIFLLIIIYIYYTKKFTFEAHKKKVLLLDLYYYTSKSSLSGVTAFHDSHDIHNLYTICLLDLYFGRSDTEILREIDRESD